MRVLLWFLVGALLFPPCAWAQKSDTQAKAAISAVLAERDRAFQAKRADAYFACCTPDYAHLDPQEDPIALKLLQANLQKQLTGAKTAEQTTSIDTFRLEGDAAVVETYEKIKLVTLLHEWLEVTTSGYKRCRYRFVLQEGSWHLGRTRVREETLEDTPRLLEPSAPLGLGELDTRVKDPAAREATRAVFPLLRDLTSAEEQKDFRTFLALLAPDFSWIRLGKDPEDRTFYANKMALAHEFIQNERVRYYLVDAKLKENGDLLLDVQQGMRFTLKLPEKDPVENVMIVNLQLVWTHSPGSWLLRRHETFTIEGFENNKRVDFIQKEKSGKVP